MSTASAKTKESAASLQDGELECRACLRVFNPKKIMPYNLFQAWCVPRTDTGGTIAHNMEKIANIQVSETDRHTKFICESCYFKLQSACQFITTVRKSDFTLQQRQLYIEVPFNVNDKIWPKPIQINKNLNGAVFAANMDVDIKEEIISDDENESDRMEGVQTVDLDIKLEPDDSEPLPIQITVNGTISLDEMNAQSSVSNGCVVYENEEHLEPVKQEPVSEDEDGLAADLPLECMLCSKPFKSVSGLKAHVIAHHSYKTVKRKVSSNPSPEKKRTDRHVCATCRRSFVTSTDLMVHETCHNKYVCYGCNEKLDSFDQLTRHQRRCKAARNRDVLKPKTLEDVMRVHEESKRKENKALKCTLCTEEFSDSYYMKIHHEIHHSNEVIPDSEQTGNSEKGSSEQSNKSDQNSSGSRETVNEDNQSSNTVSEEIKSVKSSDDTEATETIQNLYEQTENNNRIREKAETDTLQNLLEQSEIVEPVASEHTGINEDVLLVKNVQNEEKNTEAIGQSHEMNEDETEDNDLFKIAEGLNIMVEKPVSELNSIFETTKINISINVSTNVEQMDVDSIESIIQAVNSSKEKSETVTSELSVQEEPIEQVELTNQVELTEEKPNLRLELSSLVESNEQDELISQDEISQQVESNELDELTEQADTSQQVESIVRVELSEQLETTHKARSSDNAEVTEQIETTQQIESNEDLELSEQTQTSQQVVSNENVELSEQVQISQQDVELSETFELSQQVESNQQVEVTKHIDQIELSEPVEPSEQTVDERKESETQLNESVEIDIKMEMD